MSDEKLPDCDLLNILKAQANDRKDIDFKFIDELDRFRKKVSEEIRQINELFPEYTPHDEEYHLKKLFHVADTVLGRNRFEAMNSSELFVLSVSLYGHDWGMAVSNDEKQFILTGECPEGKKAEDFWLLPDEKTRFKNFAHNNQLKLNSDGHCNDISVELWREYVRETHAFRSGERVRRYFEAIDGGIADSASRVCVGHWLDFEKLHDHKSYPVDYSVLRETTNIRALSVYLRLVDLLDLAEDRTPYVIWKFVAPRNPKSKMEWDKHRALRPVTCPEYQQGRIIRVDGSTDNHEVYAALQDLKLWCETQLRGCNDLLAQMNDPRHKLDIYHVDWRVAARGFSPVSIQFEFDRDRMFEILGDEIYQSDPYVFLRELLQNSIDAIRMRREVLKQKGIRAEELGVIWVDVKHGENGDAEITWRDDGIGMNEYIVRNYLAIAGNSYYRSVDFEREGIKIDPISRFGIGILSCFMIADRIEIETYKDPYLPPEGEPIRIAIPSATRQFRVEPFAKESAEIGTTVRVFVEGKKIPKEDGSNQTKPLDVTKYLSIVAGFVEFPIVISEGDKKTIILHPKQDSENAKKRFGEEFNVQKLDFSYPWKEAVFPQDLPTARKYLKEQNLEIASDLELEGYEGFIIPFIPNNDEIDLCSNLYSSNAFSVYKRGRDIEEHEKVRCEEEDSKKLRISLSRSSSHSLLYSVYRDGILISNVTKPANFNFDDYETILVPRIVVNIPKSKTPRVDLARSEILEKRSSWDTPIYSWFSKKVIKDQSKYLLEQEPMDRFFKLGWFKKYNFLSNKSMLENFPIEFFPMLFLDRGDKFDVLEWKDLKDKPVYLFPSDLRYEAKELFNNQFFGDNTYNKTLTKWVGEKSFITKSYGYSIAIEESLGFCEYVLKKFYCFDSVQFLNPPVKNSPPICQQVWLKKNVQGKLPELKEILGKTIENPCLLSLEEKIF